MIIHPNGLKLLADKKTYRNIRKYLKSLGCTKSEQNSAIQQVKKVYIILI